MKVRIDSERVRELATLPGVVAVRPYSCRSPTTCAAFRSSARRRLAELNKHGEGVKIAIIDRALITRTRTSAARGLPPPTRRRIPTKRRRRSGALRPAAPRIKGGIDLVGDSYDADPNSATISRCASGRESARLQRPRLARRGTLPLGRAERRHDIHRRLQRGTIGSHSWNVGRAWHEGRALRSARLRLQRPTM